MDKDIINWEKTGKNGNWLAEHKMYINYGNRKCYIGTITVFKKGEYCLDQYMFPRNKHTLKRQTTTSLLLAKKKIENWILGLAKIILKSPNKNTKPNE